MRIALGELWTEHFVVVRKFRGWHRRWNQINAWVSRKTGNLIEPVYYVDEEFYSTLGR